MTAPEKAHLGRFNSETVCVSFIDHLFPNQPKIPSAQEKLSEYRKSQQQLKEIPIRQFLACGQAYMQYLELLWATDDKKERSNIKRRYLGAGTISATLYTRDAHVPLSKKIKCYNSLIALDFDDLPDVEGAKARLSSLPYVWYVGLSASRRGLFAIVPIDNDDYTRHVFYFLALRDEMARLGFKIDEACKDVTRLRYVSFDPNPYFNEDCERFCLPDDFDFEAAGEAQRKDSATGENPRLLKVEAYTAEWERKKVPLDDYNDWMTLAMSLSTLGEDGWTFLDRISQFGKGYNPEENRRKFEEFVANTRSLHLGSFFYKCQEYGVIPPNVPHYEMIPFPVEIFPESLRHIIFETHKCLNFSVDHISASLLFVASVAVGNSVIVEIKNEWVDKAILYVAIVGKPGTNKSAPLKYALRPLVERDRKELQKYEKLRAAYEEALKAPAKERKLIPEEPEYMQIVLSDFTTEVLVRQHKINPRSLAVYVDELIGFIKCFNKYRSGNDEQVWTQLYNGGSVIVNRVSSQPLNIEDTCIGVIGTIQPGLLSEFAKGKTESGFVDRWLFAYPDDSEYPKMNHEQLPRELTKIWSETIEQIYKQPYEPGAKPVKLTKDAMAVYSKWFNALADQKNVSSSSFAEMATKMERYCIRFAIVLEALKCAAAKKPVKSIGVSSVKGGIDLCYYFIACALKARKKFNNNPLDQLTERQRKIYNDLPISFTTAEGVEVAKEWELGERAFKDWLRSDFFRHISHGQYEKRYK